MNLYHALLPFLVGIGECSSSVSSSDSSSLSSLSSSMNDNNDTHDHTSVISATEVRVSTTTKRLKALPSPQELKNSDDTTVVMNNNHHSKKAVSEEGSSSGPEQIDLDSGILPRVLQQQQRPSSFLFSTEEGAEERRHRQLQRTDCGYCGDDRPYVTPPDDGFNKLITSCLKNPAGCPYAGVPMGCWDTSGITNMDYAFEYARTFKNPIKCWDVSRVTSMKSMFLGATNFNKPLNKWNVSRVKNMAKMFRFAYGFNQTIKEWDVSEVTTMDYMFDFATHFNQPLEEWDVSSVTSMKKMFENSKKMNQCLSSWADKTPSTVQTGGAMFKGSSCPYAVAPANEGPWCQGFAQACGGTLSPTVTPSPSRGPTPFYTAPAPTLLPMTTPSTANESGTTTEGTPPPPPVVGIASTSSTTRGGRATIIVTSALLLLTLSFL